MLLVLGLVSGFYNHDHQLGWNPKGVSGVISCGVTAVLALILGWFSDKGKGWALYAGLALSFMTIAMPGSRFFVAGRAYSSGDETKWLSMVVLGCTVLVALRTFLQLSLIARRGKQPS